MTAPTGRPTTTPDPPDGRPERQTDPRGQGTGEELRRWTLRWVYDNRSPLNARVEGPAFDSSEGEQPVTVVPESALEAAHRRGREEVIGEVERLRDELLAELDGDPYDPEEKGYRAALADFAARFRVEREGTEEER